MSRESEIRALFEEVLTDYQFEVPEGERLAAEYRTRLDALLMESDAAKGPAYWAEHYSQELCKADAELRRLRQFHTGVRALLAADPWHKWPDEKPTKEFRCLVRYSNGWMGEEDWNSEAGEWFREDCSRITHWRERPDPPEGIA